MAYLPHLQVSDGIRGSDVFIMLHALAVAIGGHLGERCRHNDTCFGSGDLRAFDGVMSS